MKKRFIVMLQDSTKESSDAFLGKIKEWNISWWHWLPTSWLLSDQTGKLSADIIRDTVNEVFGCHNMVIEIRDDGTDTWAGFGPKGEKRNMFNWMQETWTKPT